MKSIELRLIPAPGQKAEFLASLEPVHKTPNTLGLWSSLPNTVILEGYTRDAWSLDTSTNKWTTFQVESKDGRNKLPGFVKYLRDRQKTAFGRFVSASDNVTDASKKSEAVDMVWVVSNKQMSSSSLKCRIAPLSSIPDCPLKPRPRPTQPTAKAPPPKPAERKTAAPGVSKKKGGFGLLGNLVGAQRRTNQQVDEATTVLAKKKVTPSSQSSDTAGDIAAASSSTTSTAAATGSTGNVTELKTAGQVLSEFRQEMEQEMLDFDIAPDTVLKVKIDLASKMRLMSEEEKQSGRVTMEVLKYIVYEQAEEVNEEWIAHKEPSDFMDEAIIAIYKEGEAPPDVLEDINKAELPDEIRLQQRALQEQKQKAEQLRAHKLRMEQTKAAMEKKRQLQQDDPDEDDEFAALNTQKRDRRTIEDYEREAKRRRDS